MERWTARNEAELQRLMKRKNELMTINSRPVVALVAREGMADLHMPKADDIAEILIACADEFRDALEPFDSGERPPMPAPSNAKVSRGAEVPEESAAGATSARPLG